MTDLDDFFAKKDKKKSKSKTKFLTTDDLVKNLEDTSKRETVVKAKKVETSSETAVSNAIPESNDTASTEEKEKPIVKTLEQTEEEWKEFEEEQRKDYTGLKIGQLTLNEDDDYSPTDGDDEEGDSENISNNMFVNSSNDGPWKKVVPAEEVTQIQMESTTTTRGLYVSPAMRQQTRTAPKARKAAPDITNADYFPSLGAARPEEQRKKKNEPAFEEVRHGSRVQRVLPEPTVAKAAAASNRFQSLDEEDS